MQFDSDNDMPTIDKDEFKIVYVAPMKALAAEVVRKFSKRLAPLQVTVRELTGDMQLTRAEIQSTQMLVVTPEKYDVITRKAAQSDVELVNKIRLLIIDEVHLLHDDRGAVLESIVARTLRLVETTQSMIRIVGLSATLPNYVDVAEFLRVNLMKGMFFFDDGFRPVPLGQTFIGVKGSSRFAVEDRMNRVTFEKIEDVLEQERQAMIFVHSRKDTVRRWIINLFFILFCFELTSCFKCLFLCFKDALKLLGENWLGDAGTGCSKCSITFI
jgi:replicative superfamily II helicase